MVKKKYCSECSSPNDINNNYCEICGHKLKKVVGKKNVKYCTHCGERLEVDVDYCGECGEKVKRDGGIGVCSVCGEKYDIRNGNYCWNCGHNHIKRGVLSVAHREENIFKLLFKPSSEKDTVELILNKKCPNCNKKHQRFFNYCDYCGMKLVNK